MENNGQPVTPAPAPRSASKLGVRIALILGVGAFAGLAVFTGARVKQALQKQKQVAAERVEAQASAIKKPPAVAMHPKAASWRPRIEMTGTLKPWREADIGFETSGRLVKVNVATGDVVKERQPLAILDSQRAGDLIQIKEASARAAAAQVAIAEDQAKRAEALVKSNAIPEAQAEAARQQLALAKAQQQAAQADLGMARTGAGQYTIFSPFAGVVTKAPTSAGSVVNPGQPLIHLEDLSRLRLSATVAEEDAPLVKLGQPVVVQYRDRSVTGKVAAVIPSLDQATRRAPLEVEVPNDPNAPLMAWGFVKASIEADRELPAVKVPPTARRPGSQNEIIKVENGKAKVVRVVYTAAEDGSWYVRQGLSESDTILVAPGSDVKDGDVVAELEVR
jgi:cobalt-zinc-cadmium efflux system membrane fusion protein